MKITEKFTLIDGSFTSEEAIGIFSSVITSKINFQTIKNWSSREMFEEEDTNAKNRIPG